MKQLWSDDESQRSQIYKFAARRTWTAWQLRMSCKVRTRKNVCHNYLTVDKFLCFWSNPAKCLFGTVPWGMSRPLCPCLGSWSRWCSGRSDPALTGEHSRQVRWPEHVTLPTLYLGIILTFPYFAILLHVSIVKVDVCQGQVLHLKVVIAETVTQHYPMFGW